MKLLELFDNVAEWQFTKNSEDELEAEFNIQGVQYILRLWTAGQYGNWATEFENTSVPSSQKFGVTGQGNASAVFATVCNILKRFVAMREVYTVSFFAEESNRKKLYLRIARVVFPGWAISENGSVIEVEKKGKYNEGRVKNMAIDAEYDRQNSPGPAPTLPTLPKKQFTHSVTINGNPWKDFSSEQEAMRAANGAYNNNPRLRVSVVPK